MSAQELTERPAKLSIPATTGDHGDNNLVSSEVIDPFECVDMKLSWWQLVKVQRVAV